LAGGRVARVSDARPADVLRQDQVAVAIRVDALEPALSDRAVVVVQRGRLGRGPLKRGADDASCRGAAALLREEHLAVEGIPARAVDAGQARLAVAVGV